MYKVYQVNYGDTWQSIADKFRTSVNQLQEMNGMSMLVPGGSIVVPRVTDQDYFTVYTIQKGDNLYDIARKNQTSVDVLLNANGLEKDDYLYPGQELLIPKKGIEMVITKDGQTLSDIANLLNTTEGSIVRENEKIFLLPEQLIIVKK